MVFAFGASHVYSHTDPFKLLNTLEEAGIKYKRYLNSDFLYHRKHSTLPSQSRTDLSSVGNKCCVLWQSHETVKQNSLRKADT
jgi:hypothetical protein